MIDAAGSLLNITGMQNLIDAVLGIAVATLAIGVAVRAHGGKFTKVVEMLAVVLIAAMVAWLAHGANFSQVGDKLFSTVFG